MGELLTATYDKVFNLPCVNLRFFMVYGPRQPSSGAYAIVTGKFAAQKSLGLPLTIEGSGDQYRDFIHVKDIVEGILRAYHSDVRGVTINLGTGEKHSIKQVADLISDNQVHVPPRPHDLHGTLANTTLAEDLLGFIPSRNFSVEIKSLLQSDPRTQLDPFWNLGQVLDRLDEVIPGFPTRSMQEQDTLIRAFGIEQLLQALFK
jgi:nucleoside-diphosphate-sugar epimerase